jgi:hypothetical protein
MPLLSWGRLECPGAFGVGGVPIEQVAGDKPLRALIGDVHVRLGPRAVVGERWCRVEHHEVGEAYAQAEHDNHGQEHTQARR